MNAWTQIVGTLTMAAVGLLGLVIVVSALVFALRAARRRSLRRKRASPQRVCDRCGYDLSQNTIPRCPECGAMAGFQKSAEELGIDREVNFTSHHRED